MSTIHLINRSVLTEIPDRLEALQVATHNEFFEITSVPLILDNSMDFDSPQAPSPDELIIRQRGRRKISLNWSPEKTNSIQYPFQKTPTKYLASQRILRSSPRKRLAMALESNSSPVSSPSKVKISPRKSALNTTEWTSTPVARKKLCLEEIPIAQTNTETPLQILLNGLNQDQLVDIILNLVKSDNKLETKVRNNLPIPDIRSMEEELIHIKRNIFKSLPTSRLCRKTDSVSYTRAAPHLITFKKAIVNRTKILHDSTHWDALFDYITMAWSYVRATPLWDNVSHNNIRTQCFKILSLNCIAAVKSGGQRLGKERLQNLEKNLKIWSKDYEDVGLYAKSLNKILNKYRQIQK